jgi:hypothetical protein
MLGWRRLAGSYLAKGDKSSLIPVRSSLVWSPHAVNSDARAGDAARHGMAIPTPTR